MTRSADLWEAYMRTPGSSTIEEVQAVDALRGYAAELEAAVDTWKASYERALEGTALALGERDDSRRMYCELGMDMRDKLDRIAAHRRARGQNWDPAVLWPDQDVASLLCRDHESGGGRSE